MKPSKIITKLALLLLVALAAGLWLYPDTRFLAVAATNPTPTARASITPLPTAKQKGTPVALPTKTPTPVQFVLPTPTPSSPGLPPTPRPPHILTRPPNINAVSAIAVDVNTGRILYDKNMHAQHPMASTTKIMTALTLLSLYPTNEALEAQTVVSDEDLVGEANMGLRRNERIKLSTLLLGLLTNSANEAGMSLARYAGASLPGAAAPVDKFVALMNSYALTLGMHDSHYANPHGLDQTGHYTSAFDLAISGWHAIQNPIYRQKSQYLQGRVDGHDIYNVNTFLRRYPGATGVKPGFTDDAGHCLVASASRGDNSVIVVVMNDPNMAGDTDNLLDYAFTLLEGRADQPLENVNLGMLTVPHQAPVVKRKPLVSSKTLQAAFSTDLKYTLKLAASSIPN